MDVKDMNNLTMSIWVRRILPTSLVKLIYRSMLTSQNSTKVNPAKFHPYRTDSFPVSQDSINKVRADPRSAKRDPEMMMKSSRRRRYGVSGNHRGILTQLLKGEDIPAGVKKTIVEALYETKRNSTYDRRRMGAKSEHYSTLMQLKERADDSTSYKLKNDIDEAVYALDARSKSQMRRKALALTT